MMEVNFVHEFIYFQSLTTRVNRNEGRVKMDETELAIEGRENGIKVSS